MKLQFSKLPAPASVSFSERRGVVCDARCRSRALRDAAFDRAIVYGHRFS